MLKDELAALKDKLLLAQNENEDLKNRIAELQD